MTRGLGLGVVRLVEQLERDVTFEARIPGPVDGAEGAAADLAADLEGAPGGGVGAGGRAQIGQPPQLLDDAPVPAVAGARFRQVPIDPAAVGNGFRQREQAAFPQLHG